ncbi:MAG: uracil-DNA glycosylase [Myxococcales bacterium]|nr:uracil-DNA glycosylase [Myxococcales bacterium]
MADEATRDEVRSIASGLAVALRRQSELGVGTVPTELARRAAAAFSAILQQRPPRPASLDDRDSAAPPPARAARAPESGASAPASPERARARGPASGQPWVPQADRSVGVGSPALAAIREDLGDCQRCGLCARRTNIVFGVGNPSARLMFVGEGPGADEDVRGEPFVGKAGQLLDKMITAMGYDRGAVYIANIVKCRPPQNRDPEADEVAACLPYLQQQIDAVAPEVIVALGRVAASALLGRSVGIMRERGTWHTHKGRALMLTYHPSLLLRAPEHKREAWLDLQDVMRRLASPTE